MFAPTFYDLLDTIRKPADIATAFQRMGNNNIKVFFESIICHYPCNV